jgi:hypothetical protein
MTTQAESQKIAAICLKHNVSMQTLFLLLRDLHEEIGQKSDNSSVKETIAMLFRHIESIAKELIKPGAVKQGPSEPIILRHPGLNKSRLPNWFWVCSLITIVIFHGIIWLGLVASCIALIILAPVYISFPLIAFCFVQATTRERCPVTRWENYIRKQLNMPTITSFGLHYFYKPFFDRRNK